MTAFQGSTRQNITGGSLGHEDFAESLGLFADKVLPSVRGLP